VDVVLGDMCGGSNSTAWYALWYAFVYLVGVSTLSTVDLCTDCGTDVPALRLPLSGLRAHIVSLSAYILCMFVNPDGVDVLLRARDRCAILDAGCGQLYNPRNTGVYALV
jgi:hypothetical protein